MQFGIIKPTEQSATIEDHATIEKAMAHLGLKNVDHGILARCDKAHPIGLAIVVYEFGLLEPPETQSFFHIQGNLFCGNAVLYGFDVRGETCNVPILPRTTFMPNAAAVERLIQLGFVRRPQTTVNGAVVWQWPAKKGAGKC
jgi:hypothetical protein